jgi:hypothetical protein
MDEELWAMISLSENQSSEDSGRVFQDSGDDSESYASPFRFDVHKAVEGSFDFTDFWESSSRFIV